MPAIATLPKLPTQAELTRRFGPMPAHRIRLDRYPATEADVEELEAREDRLYELVDGILLEKVVAYIESVLALAIGAKLREFVKPQKLGIVSGADGMMRLFPGLVRIPDAAFTDREQFPEGRVGPEAIPDLHPDLAVEVLSESNTDEEMDEKLRDYFESGCRLVWLIDPPTKSALVFTKPDRASGTSLTIHDSLDGGEVLPGFTLPLAELFAELDL